MWPSWNKIQVLNDGPGYDRVVVEPIHSEHRNRLEFSLSDKQGLSSINRAQNLSTFLVQYPEQDPQSFFISHTGKHLLNLIFPHVEQPQSQAGNLWFTNNAEPSGNLQHSLEEKPIIFLTSNILFYLNFCLLQVLMRFQFLSSPKFTHQKSKYFV